MTEISSGILSPLVAVALSSEAEPVGRAVKLAELVGACRAAGDTAAAELALGEALGMLATATSRPGYERPKLAHAALAVGETANSLERHDLAREAFLAAATALEHDRDNEMLPLAWYGAGWASVREGRGQQAVKCFRSAAGLTDGRLDLDGRIEILRSLAEAELAWGEDKSCDSALLAGCEAIRSEAEVRGDGESALAAAAGHLRSCAERLERDAPASVARMLEQGLGGAV